MKYRDPSTGQFKDLTVKVSDTLPIGVQMPYGGTTPPTGWLICDGSAVSRTTYADLFAVIGTSYGAGNGTTTFNLPNKKGRNSVGLNSTDTDFNTIGKTGGEKTHTLTVEEIPSHTHDVRILGDSNGGGTVSDNYQLQIGSYEHRQRLSTYTTGGGQAHNILQPYEVDNWIIKAWQPIAVPGIVTNDMTSESTKDVPSVKAVKDYINHKEIIEVRLTENQKVTTSSITTVMFDAVYYKQGDELTLENGGIRIGEGISTIRIDTSLWTENSVGGSYCAFYIYKNNEELTYNIKQHITPPTWDTATTFKYIDVQEGDLITIKVRFNNAGDDNKIAAYSHGSRLSVMALN